MSHSVYLPDFERFWESRDQPQPGSFLSPGSKREDPGNEVDYLRATYTYGSQKLRMAEVACLYSFAFLPG